MATTAPEHTALEEAAEAIRRRGFVGGVQTLGEVGWQRLRSGELGALPVIVALAAIWTFFQVKQDVFLSATNLSNLSIQIGVTGTIAIGIVLVLLLGEIDLSVGAVALLCSALIGWSTFNHSWAWYWAIAFALAAGLYAASRLLGTVRRRRAGLPVAPIVVVVFRTVVVAAISLLTVAILNGT